MTQALPIDVPLKQITCNYMRSLLNDAFYLPDGREVILVEATEIEQKQSTLHSWQRPESNIENKPEERVPFTLVFQFPVEHSAKQGIYSIFHTSEGYFEGIFFTPIAQDKDGLYFEAVFS